MLITSHAVETVQTGWIMSGMSGSDDHVTCTCGTLINVNVVNRRRDNPDARLRRHHA
jgi:hypothetical protein